MRLTILLSAIAALSFTGVDAMKRRTFSDRAPMPAHMHATGKSMQHQSRWSLDSLLSGDVFTSTAATTTAAISFPNSSFTAAALADEVHSLPGLVDTLNFRHFSGYLQANANNTKHIHYWLALSQNDSTSDPLVWWTNGGPGCSGMIAMFEEHGPWRVQPDNSTVLLNPYSWNKRASVVYWEGPVGVGFSYANDTDATYSQSGDNQTAIDSYYALTSFFAKFPQFNTGGNDFYLTAESYGGHYIPQLAKEYIDSNTAGKYPNVTGLLIGNPIIDPASNEYWGFDQSYYSHQVVDYISWIAVERACINPYNADPYNPSNGTGFVAWNDTACNEADLNINELINNLGLDFYGLDYPYCSATEQQRERAYFASEKAALLAAPQTLRDLIGVEQVRGTQVNMTYFDACVDAFTVGYLNRADVMEAIHVTLNYTGELDNNMWNSCGNSVYVGWQTVNVNDYYLYLEQTLQYLFDVAPQMDITIFSGDDDTVCPPIGTQQWLNNFKQFGGDEDLVVMTPWQKWNQTEEPDEPGGYFQNFDKITFVTAHGAGHEVSFYEPQLGYDLFSQYLDGVFSLPNAGEGEPLAYIPVDPPTSTMAANSTLSPASLPTQVATMMNATTTIPADQNSVTGNQSSITTTSAPNSTNSTL